MRHIALLALPFAIGALVSAPNAAQADPGPDNFGQHVSTCAETMGFAADHNPGMHQGLRGWDGMPC